MVGAADVAIVMFVIRNWSLHDEDDDDQRIVPGDSIVGIYATPIIDR